jgi:hypothetical protein
MLQAWLAVSRRQDAWYDRFAGTCVLRAGQGGAPSQIGPAPMASVFD